jgi:PKD repeat protein
MKKITIMMFAFLVSLTGLFAQTSCYDWNEYVDYKNTSGTGYYILSYGAEEYAAQTYHYSGPGKVLSAKIEGMIPSGPNGASHVHLYASVYNVDANNRPTGSALATRSMWWWYGQTTKTVNFSGGVSVNSNFAIVVRMSAHWNGVEFRVKYTGDGEGNGEDLPSVAGTTTGGNWVSLLPAKDGDLYLTPKMQHYITSDFSASATCNVAVGQTVNFTDMSSLSVDPMFNTITLPGYTGSATVYDWDFGDATSSTLQNPSHSYATAGVYTVTLTTTIDKWPMGGSTCTDTKTMEISVGLAVTGTGTNLTCNNDNSGSVTLSGNGGKTPYQYSLNGVTWQSSTTFSGLAAGTYPIYIKDALGCEETGSSVTITEPSVIVIASPIGVTTATCGNNDGALLVAASGGTGTLQYSLDNISYQASGAFNNLGAGNYNVYVKDANGCIVSTNVVINNTTSPTLTLQSYTNVSCNGGSDGTITLIGSGGTGALQYSIDGVNFQATGNFTGVSAGFYTPIVKDAASCIGTIPCINGPCGITITEPTAITFSLSQTATLCNGSSDGQVDVLSAIGGTGTLTFSIDGINFQSGTNFSGLIAGSYTVTVKDVAGCTQTAAITVTEPNAIVVSIVSSTNLSCNNSDDGEVIFSATGGNSVYTYSIDGVNFYPSGEFNSLAAGTYTLTVKDGNNCTGTTSVTLTEPSLITATITTGNSTCSNADGTILAVAAGGSGSGYTYSIDGGVTSNGTGSFSGLVDSTYYVIVVDGAGCEEVFTAIVSDSDGPTIAGSTSTNVTCNGGSDGSITITSVTGGTGTILYSVDGGAFQTSNVLTGLAAGQHTVVVKDANGCSGEITITLTQPSGFTIVLTGSSVLCNGGNTGSITVAAAGGSGTLAYSIDGVNFQSPTVFNGLVAGTYTVTVRDAGGCTGTASITLTEPSVIDVALGTLNVSCYGGSDGSVISSAVGGTGTLQYSIDGINYQATGTFTGLSAANYTLYVKDANGCIITTLFTINEPNDLVISLSTVTDVSCAGGNDGVVDITISGGTMPYTYAWSNGSTTEDIFNLSAGSFSVTVTDANGCTVNANFTVIEPSNPIIINGTVTDATGATTPDGDVDITVTGGTAPYTFSWSNGGTTEDITGLLPGVYVVIVTDANGCESTTSFTVNYNVGVNEITNEDGLNIYPNPVKDAINVELSADKKAERVILINMTGEIIYEATPNSNQFEVDVRFYAEGLYFINIHIGDNVITRKVIINR